VKTRVMAVALVVALLAALVPVAGAQGDEVVITWWTEPSETVPTNIQEVFIDAWNEAHPGYRLEIVPQEDLPNTLRTAIAAGEAPDIIQTAGAAFIAELVNAGTVVPLDSYAEEWGWEEKLLPWAYQSGFIGGSLYSVPLTYESMILLYNQTLFDEKGWTPPTNLEEFEALAEAAVADGINPLIYGNVGWQPTNEHLVGIYLNNVAGPQNVYKALIGEKPWTDPEFVEAIELLKTHIADNGWFSGSLENYFAIGWDDYWPELSTGSSAMMMIGTWGFYAVDEPFAEVGAEWNWAPLPIFNERAGEYNYELATGSTISVNAASKHVDVAASVIDFLISDPDRVLEMSGTRGFGEWMVPVRVNPEDFPAGTDERFVRFFADFAKVTGEGRIGYTTWTFWPAVPNVQLWQEIELVWYDEMSVEDYLANHQAAWDQARAEGVTLNIPAPGVTE